MGNKFLKQINNLIIIESIKVLQILEIDQTFLGHHAFRALKATRAIYKNP
jgi:flagellar biosynthesis regulator FlbT